MIKISFYLHLDLHIVHISKDDIFVSISQFFASSGGNHQCGDLSPCGIYIPCKYPSSSHPPWGVRPRNDLCMTYLLQNSFMFRVQWGEIFVWPPIGFERCIFWRVLDPYVFFVRRFLILILHYLSHSSTYSLHYSHPLNVTLCLCHYLLHVITDFWARDSLKLYALRIF